MNYQFSSVILIIYLPILILSLHYFTIQAALAADSTVTNNILLNCGASGTFQDANNRTWIGDINTNFISKQTSQYSNVPYQNPNIPTIPFGTARIFTENYTYTFPLAPGRYFLRLYFYPFNYSDRLASDSFFAATAGKYTLLSNFSAFMTINSLDYMYIIREFYVNVMENALDLTFTPCSDRPNAYAFVNGIEIVASPDIFSDAPAYLVDGHVTPFYYNSSMAFQTMYRLNVGGRALILSEDFDHLYRTWNDDSPYIFGAAFGVTYQNDPNVTITYPKTVPKYIAPVLVYETARSMGPNPEINLNYNLTWILTVDSGFYYLLRFHFCEIQYLITKVNQRVFNIYINNQTAQNAFDVIVSSGGIGIPVYSDYIVVTSGSGQMDMWIELHPDPTTEPMYYNAILNGLEVFKMGMVGNNLAGTNPVLVPENNVNQSQAYNGKAHHKINGKTIAIVCGALAGSVLLGLIGCIYLCVIYRDKKGKEESVEVMALASENMNVPVSTERNINASQSTITDSFNTFSSASVGTYHDAR